MKPHAFFFLGVALVPFLNAQAEEQLNPFSVEMEASTLSDLDQKTTLMEEESTLSAEPFFTIPEEQPVMATESVKEEPLYVEQENPSLLPAEAAPLELPIAIETPEAEEPSVIEIAVEETPVIEEPIASTEVAEETRMEQLDSAVEPESLVTKDTREEEPIFQKEAPLATQEIAFNTLNVGTVTPKAEKKIQISLSEVFAGSPIIYTVLLIMSVFSCALWIYNFLSLRQATQVNHTLVKTLREKLTSNQYDEALGVCLQGDNLLCKMLAAGINARKFGQPQILEIMTTEGKRISASFWQRTAILSDIAVIAPMLGLLGTVLGMFYAFYDLNRSVESMATLFDGLGISVGTTVAGLIVAILAMIFQSSTKYRLVKALSQVENEAKSLTNLLGN